MNRINCRQLAKTVMNVEMGEPSKCGVLCVYDMDDSELCIAIFNKSKTCANFFNTTTKAIDMKVFNKTLFRDRFKIERVKL